MVKTFIAALILMAVPIGGAHAQYDPSCPYYMMYDPWCNGTDYTYPYWYGGGDFDGRHGGHGSFHHEGGGVHGGGFHGGSGGGRGGGHH